MFINFYRRENTTNLLHEHNHKVILIKLLYKNFIAMVFSDVLHFFKNFAGHNQPEMVSCSPKMHFTALVEVVNTINTVPLKSDFPARIGKSKSRATLYEGDERLTCIRSHRAGAATVSHYSTRA